MKTRIDKRERIINKEFKRKSHGTLVISHAHESRTQLIDKGWISFRGHEM